MAHWLKGEMFLLVKNSDARFGWDTSDVVVLDGAVAAEYVDNGFVVSIAAGEKIMSGCAAPICAAAPTEMVEREISLPPQAPRAPPCGVHDRRFRVLSLAVLRRCQPRAAAHRRTRHGHREDYRRLWCGPRRGIA